MASMARLSQSSRWSRPSRRCTAPRRNSRRSCPGRRCTYATETEVCSAAHEMRSKCASGGVVSRARARHAALNYMHMHYNLISGSEREEPTCKYLSMSTQIILIQCLLIPIHTIAVCNTVACRYVMHAKDTEMSLTDTALCTTRTRSVDVDSELRARKADCDRVN